MTAPAVLDVRGLTVEFMVNDRAIRAVDDIEFTVRSGEVLGVVGESGSGKSTAMLAVLDLLPKPTGRIVGGEILVNGVDLRRAGAKAMRAVRGSQVGMIFQNPMTSLNPVLEIGAQIVEALRSHGKISRGAARKRAIELLESVGVPSAADRMHQYPHQFSGGMLQRVMIAIAIANGPSLIIADEPTTALDVTIQAQVLEVIRHAVNEVGTAMVLVTHDLGVIAEVADEIIVMYGGRIVERGTVAGVFANPRHPYTSGLMAGTPRVDSDVERLTPIPGSPVRMDSLPPGCSYHPRCFLMNGRELCRTETPVLMATDAGSRSACHYFAELEGGR